MLEHATDLIRGSWRYAQGLRKFLSLDLDLDQAEAFVTRQLKEREESFLQVLELGVYANERSPYRRLLLHAGFEFEQLRDVVRSQGLEAALAQLYEAGVYVTLDEFKGRKPVRRPGLEFAVTDRDFDNPLLPAHYATRTGGSRGGGTRVPIDFDFLASEAAIFLVHLHAKGIADRPIIIWQAQPPSAMGLRTAFRLVSLKRPAERWFAPNRPDWSRQGIQGRALLAYTLITSRLSGRPLPSPEHVDAAQEDRIVRYLSEAVSRGQPALVFCVPSQAVRLCLAAENSGMDISGTAIFGGGEPFTEGKEATLRRVGVLGSPSYAMQEAGSVSFPCGNPAAPDDMHILKNKLAILQYPANQDSEFAVDGLFHTTLLTSAPKLMLNVESGDYAVVEERACGCRWQQLGLTTHIRHVRSYEKLTSEGVMFMGSMLHELLEETLPARFGGGPTDYQLVEEEEDGVTRVSIVVSPRVGPVDEHEVAEAMLESVGFTDWSRRMAQTWRDAGTLRVSRREPYTTGAGKILPLHVLPGGTREASHLIATNTDGTTV